MQNDHKEMQNIRKPTLANTNVSYVYHLENKYSSEAK